MEEIGRKKTNQTVRSLHQIPTNVPKGTDMPKSNAVEECVLGSLLMDRESITDVVDILQPESFFNQPHQLIYSAILALYERGAGIDLHTVVDQLRRDGNFTAVGGLAMITNLADSAVSAFHIGDHAKILAEQAMRRKLLMFHCMGKSMASDQTKDIFELLDSSEDALHKISSTYIATSAVSLRSMVDGMQKEAAEGIARDEMCSGLSTGFADLDALTDGFHPSEMVVVAARPSMGKTAMMLHFLRAIASSGVPTVFFTLEETNRDLFKRMISAAGGIPFEKIRGWRLTNLKDYNTTMANLSQLPILVDDAAPLSLFEFRTKCRRLVKREGVRVVFLDYLQLMTAPKSFNREQEIATISRSLKALSKSLNITIIVASQLSRSVETRGGDRRPHLSDLRESGAIEQDADVVMCLYRSEYYGIAQDEEGNNTRGLAELLIRKNRKGPTGRVMLGFDTSTINFGPFRAAPSEGGDWDSF